MNEHLCVLEHRQDPDRPRRAVDGERLCVGHKRDLERLIAEMPARYDELERAGGTGGPRPRGAHSELVVDYAISEHRAQIQHDLVWWCIYVADERGITRPARADVNTTASWLGTHVDWIAADRAGAEECLPVMRELTGRAIALTDLPVRRVPIDAPCILRRDGEDCPGSVTLFVRGDDWYARCDHPDCTERQEEITPYLRKVRKDVGVTEEDVVMMAARFGFAVDDVVLRQWRHRGHVAVKAVGGVIWYDLASVAEYLAKRKAMREKVA